MIRFVLLFLLPLTLYAQVMTKPVARIGDKQITVKEFKMRYELSPFINPRSGEDSLKRQFLLSLIAEKLFGFEAREAGLDSTGKFEFAFKPLEKMFVRDALYNKEITGKIKIDVSDILKGVAKYNTKLIAEIFTSRDSAWTGRIFNELNSGISPDSLSKIRGGISSEISFGDINYELTEDTLYSYSAGDFTRPIKIEDAWFIFYIKNKISGISSPEEKNIADRVEKIIRDRRSEKAYYEYLKKVFEDKVIEADKFLFLTLSKNIHGILKTNKAGSADTSQKYYLSDPDFEKLKSDIGRETLSKTFFTFDDKTVTLNDFLSDLHFEGISFNSPDINSLNQGLSRRVKKFIQKEYLADIGYKLGLRNLPEVKEQLEMWKDHYLAQFYKNTFTDSARPDNEEVYNYFLKQQKQDKIKGVNIIELLTDSLEVIEYVLNKLDEGEDFRELAVKFTKREWVKKRGGEFGLFPVTMFGEIGRIANEMKIGDIYGPIKLDEGYSIFKLIDIQESEDSIVASFGEVNEQMRSSLFYENMNKILTAKTAELARKYKIIINDDVLNSLEVIKIKMFALRLMGFGGNIAAVPFITPWYEWFRQSEIKELP